MFSGPLHKSCQPCPWGPNSPCLGVIYSRRLIMEKIKGSPSLKPSGPQPMFSDPLHKSCQSRLWGPNWPCPGIIK